MLKYLLFTLLVTITAQLTNSQGPVPPRLSIPGAVPVTYNRPQFRNEKIVRVRRPTPSRPTNSLIPQIPPRVLEDDKPVTESTEDNHPDVFLPQLLREQQLAQTQQAQFQQQADSFINSQPNSVQDYFSNTHLLNEELTPQTPAPPPTFSIPQPSRPTPRPQFNDYGIGRFGNDRPQPLPATAPPAAQPRQQVIRNRPQLRAQYDAQPAPAPAPAPPQRLRPKPIQSRPIIDQNQLQEERDQANTRRQQPVAQTIRKWREENEDGSITWGYENDDGSFKEELIGIDCVTKGTYGYIDPDGNKREYHYETGIKCDPNTRETEEELQDNGFINYEDQKAVLPNGVEIDMAQLGRKKSKRPGANFRV